MIAKMYYCGQREQSGHHIWPSDQSSYLSGGGDFNFLDNPDRWCGHFHKQGIARLSHHDGMTVFGFREYTIDKRPGSHSTFAASGTHSAEEMEEAARRLFPDVWARFDFHITATRETDAEGTVGK